MPGAVDRTVTSDFAIGLGRTAGNRLPGAERRREVERRVFEQLVRIGGHLRPHGRRVESNEHRQGHEHGHCGHDDGSECEPRPAPSRQRDIKPIPGRNNSAALMPALGLIGHHAFIGEDQHFAIIGNRVGGWRSKPQYIRIGVRRIAPAPLALVGGGQNFPSLDVIG